MCKIVLFCWNLLPEPDEPAVDVVAVEEVVVVAVVLEVGGGGILRPLMGRQPWSRGKPLLGRQPQLFGGKGPWVGLKGLVSWRMKGSPFSLSATLQTDGPLALTPPGPEPSRTIGVPGGI